MPNKTGRPPLTRAENDRLGDQLALGIGELGRVVVIGDERVRQLVDPGDHAGVRFQALGDDDRLGFGVTEPITRAGVADCERVAELRAELAEAGQ